MRDCCGFFGFRHLTAWTVINKRVRKCFNGTWHIGTIKSFNLLHRWFALQYSYGLEEYTPSEISLIYFGDCLPRAFYMAFDIVLPSELVAANQALSTDFDLDCNLHVNFQ